MSTKRERDLAKLGVMPGNLAADLAGSPEEAHRLVTDAIIADLTAENADLRDRLALFAPLVCKRCDCAPMNPYQGEEPLCDDCGYALLMGSGSNKTGAYVSVGMRALCGRRLVEAKP